MKARPCNFASFKKEKKQSAFILQAKNEKKKPVVEKNQEVLITVGLTEFECSSLQNIFGKSFSVQLCKDMSYDKVLEKSLKKWEDYDRAFLRECG